MSDQLTIDAGHRVLKARTELIHARRFYGVLVSNVEPIITRRHKTAATNGKQHFWNPDYIATLTQPHLLFVQAHESEHDARKHSSRRFGRDPEKWNEACDYAINVDLVDEGFVPPPGILLDPKYRGWSAEEIYRAREIDEARQQQQQPQPQDQDGDDESTGQGGGEGDDDDQDGDDRDEQGEGSDDASGEGQDGEQGGDDAGDDEGNGDDQDGDGEGDASSEAGDGEGQDGDGAGDDAGDQGNGQGGGEGEGDADTDADGQGGGAGEPGDGDDEGKPGEGRPVVGDVGGCGEVLDAAETPGEIAEQEQHWERITRQAASMAKAVGQLPGHVTREIERSNNPTQDWRETLRAWFDQGALRVETWNRPNRRFAGRGLILPGSQRDGVNKACFLIDTSGSVFFDPVALQLVRDEAQAALDDGVIEEAVVIYGDTQVTRVDTYRTGDEIEFDPRGGGGTDMKPLFQYVAEQHDDASLCVCFTDLYIGDPGPEPHCPVLFAVHGYPDAVRQLCANAPWGAVAIDVGAH